MEQEDREKRPMVRAIRNFVEKIVDGLVENVDDTSIDRIYEDSECKRPIARNTDRHRFGDSVIEILINPSINPDDRFLEEHRPPLIAALTRLATCLEASLTSKYRIRNPI